MGLETLGRAQKPKSMRKTIKGGVGVPITHDYSLTHRYYSRMNALRDHHSQAIHPINSIHLISPIFPYLGVLSQTPHQPCLLRGIF